MDEVCYELMRPEQVVQRRKDFPLAYLCLGIIEWHGLQNPFGLDGLKVHEIVKKAAVKGGGLVFPVVWYGEVREIFMAEANVPVRADISRAMDLPESNFYSGYMGGNTIETQVNLYQNLLLHILYQIKSLGFEAIYMLAGHGPLLPYASLAATVFERRTGIKTAASRLPDLADGFKEGHGDRFETGVMMTLRPELVDMTRLPEGDKSQLFGIDGDDPRDNPKELGDKLVPLCVDALIKKAGELLKRCPTQGGMKVR